MRTLLNQLRVRLILGAMLFLLALTGAVILVVRDSLQFSARNMQALSHEGMLKQQEEALLAIAMREAELSDHAIHHNPADLAPLVQRLQSLNVTPHSYAFVTDENGRVVAASLENIPVQLEPAVLNTDLQTVLQQMQKGQHAVSRIEVHGDPVLIAYAPLKETGWSLAIVTPVSDVTARAESLTGSIESSVSDILRLTLLTIGYFAVLVIVGIVLTARALTGPIETLVQGTRSIAAGDFSVRIPVKSSDELGGLATSFNRMAEELLKRNTELTKTNETLSEREARLRLITEITTDALYEWDVAAGKTQWSHSYRTLFGYPAEGFHEHMWWRERVHPDDLPAAVERLETAFRNRDEFLSFEYRYRRADGSYAHVVDKGFIFYDESGQPVRQVGAMIDITDRVTLSEAQARAALEERQRLARELHDSVTQSLYSLTLLAEASRRTARLGDIEKVIANISRLGETAQQALKEMRLLVYELRPLALEQAGLAEALQHRLDAVEKRAGIETRLGIDMHAELPAHVEHGLYRIAQETLNNSLKHAQATAVSVHLRSHDGTVEMEIKDNGRGFDLEQARDQGGLGLTSIRERTEALGGELSITSTPAQGTCVQIRLLLKE